MTESDTREWTEFKREIRKDIKDINKNLSDMASSLASMTAQVSQKMDEADVINIVDKKLYYHKSDCVVRSPEDKSDRKTNTGSIKIDLSGISPLVRKIAYITIPLLMGFGGHELMTIGVEDEIENTTRIESVGKDNRRKVTGQVDKRDFGSGYAGGQGNTHPECVRGTDLLPIDDNVCVKLDGGEDN